MNGWNYATTWETMAREVPDREAVICGDRRITFGELDHRADRLAHVLAADGIGAGDAVAISLTNRPEYLEAFFAALKLGAAPVNLNYQYVAAELAHVLADCAAAAVVFHVDATDRVAEAIAGLNGVAIPLMLSVDGEYEKALAGAPEGPAPRSRPPSGDDRLFLYTGGTTGRPKGVVWRVEDYYLQGWEAARPGTEPPDPSTAMRAGKRAATLLPASPLVHATALGMATATLSGGGTVVLRDDQRLDAAELWRLVTRERVAVMSIVGETFARPLIEALDRRRRALARPVVAASDRVVGHGVQRREQACVARPNPRAHDRRHARCLGGDDHPLHRDPRRRLGADVVRGEGQRARPHRRRTRRGARLR